MTVISRLDITVIQYSPFLRRAYNWYRSSSPHRPNLFEIEAILLIDTNNAFNSIQTNCQFLLHYNYVDGDVPYSQEGTTQKDPPMYALQLLNPSHHNLSHSVDDIKQIWYADDATAAGESPDFNHINKIGLKYGYISPMPPKHGQSPQRDIYQKQKLPL